MDEVGARLRFEFHPKEDERGLVRTRSRNLTENRDPRNPSRGGLRVTNNAQKATRGRNRAEDVTRR